MFYNTKKEKRENITISKKQEISQKVLWSAKKNLLRKQKKKKKARQISVFAVGETHSNITLQQNIRETAIETYAISQKMHKARDLSPTERTTRKYWCTHKQYINTKYHD